MSTPVVITCVVLVAIFAVSVLIYALESYSRLNTIGEEIVIAVVEEQIRKERERKEMAPFDKPLRRLACMQRFERMATERRIKMPADLAARINAQLTIKGM